MSYSDFEKFKWQVLDDAPHRHQIGIAWYWAKKLEPGAPDERLASLVERVVLELFDEGLIFCAYASRDEGYNLAEEDFVRVTRVEVAFELARPLDYVEPEDNLFWLVATEEGIEVLDSLPREAFLEPPAREYPA